MFAMDIKEIIGQIFGIIAVILGFCIYQVKDAKKLLLVQILTSAVFCIHYGLIGALSGFVLNGVGIVRSTVYYYRDKKIFSGKYIPVLFAVIMAVVGVKFWEAWYSIFVVLGLVINSYALSFKNPQNLRKSILITCPMVIVYNAFSYSYGGIVYESVSIVSGIIGIIRYRGLQKKTSLNG